jgi:hypothetical protein
MAVRKAVCLDWRVCGVGLNKFGKLGEACCEMLFEYYHIEHQAPLNIFDKKIVGIHINVPLSLLQCSVKDGVTKWTL